MKDIEKIILQRIQRHGPKLSWRDLWEHVPSPWEEPFGAFSPEFINNPLMTAFLAENANDASHALFILHLRINDYLYQKSDAKLAEGEQYLIKYFKPENKPMGTALLPGDIVNPDFMKKLYATEDEPLIKLFLRYAPEPPSNIFETGKVPQSIAKKEQEARQLLTDKDYKADEKQIVSLQRRFRSIKRKRETTARVLYYYNMDRIDYDKMTHDANRPYKPHCRWDLAGKIIKATDKIELFQEVKHLTHVSAIRNIFDEGLKGRNTLMQSYNKFRTAALQEGDIKNGDLNVVCLGSQNIDDRARHGIELTFDAKKIAQDNPCVFFKQKDLGYVVNKIRSVKIGELEVFFSHTTGRQTFALYSEKSHEMKTPIPYAVTYFRNWLPLISDNVDCMHQILTLNFFRFIDELEKNHESTEAGDLPRAYKIYKALDGLEEEELVRVLKEIGAKISDTMEFNFYGVYQIDFSALISICDEDKKYILNVQHFVEALNMGNESELTTAKANMPEIFKSYRFIDFLLLNVTNNEIKTQLSANQNANNRNRFII